MYNSKYLCESGMLSGFHYHDQFLESIGVENEATVLTIRNSEGVSYSLNFKDCFITSVNSFVPGNIVGSCFIWLSNNLPKWFESNNIYTGSQNTTICEKRYTFYLTSSYGADIFITFGSFYLLKTTIVGDSEKIWEF